MTLLVTVISLLIQAALLFVVYGISQELKTLRELQVNHPQPSVILRAHHTRVAMNQIQLGSETNLVGCHSTTYAVWAWRGTCWELELGTVPPGFEPVGPPQFNGAYGGQRVKKECVRC